MSDFEHSPKQAPQGLLAPRFPERPLPQASLETLQTPRRSSPLTLAQGIKTSLVRDLQGHPACQPTLAGMNSLILAAQALELKQPAAGGHALLAQNSFTFARNSLTPKYSPLLPFLQGAEKLTNELFNYASSQQTGAPPNLLTAFENLAKLAKP